MSPWRKTPPDAAALSRQPAWESNRGGRCLWGAPQDLVHVPARLQGVGPGVAKQAGRVKLRARALHAGHPVSGWGRRQRADPLHPSRDFSVNAGPRCIQRSRGCPRSPPFGHSPRLHIQGSSPTTARTPGEAAEVQRSWREDGGTVAPGEERSSRKGSPLEAQAPSHPRVRGRVRARPAPERGWRVQVAAGASAGQP